MKSIGDRIGAWDSRRRAARLDAATIASSEQGPPVPLIYGRTRLRGTWIHSPWGREAEPIIQRTTIGK